MRTDMAQSQNWDIDSNLERDMSMYIQQGLKRSEVLDFLERDYPQYRWSVRSLARRMKHFGISYYDRTVTVQELEQAVRAELNGPGELLGYRAMQKKIRQEHQLNVTRQQVYDVLYHVNPELLEARAPGLKRKKKKGNFTSKGPNWVLSMDGHDKLMGYQNSTFPLAIYGCMDTATRKLLWLKIWVSNSNPQVVGRWYLEYLLESRTLSNMIRLDKGTETGTLATMHAFLRSQQADEVDAVDTVIYGPSTSNQIERWWKELHERLEKYYKRHLAFLKDNGYYDPHDDMHRKLLAYVMIPLLQKELDIFKDTVWNTHRIRAQKHTVLPDGVPNHMFSFPENYGLEQCGFPLSEAQLKEVAMVSGVLELDDDFLTVDVRQQCEHIVEHPEDLEPNNCAWAFRHLKSNFVY